MLSHILKNLLQNEAGEAENEWRFAAMVLDRVCLLLFLGLSLFLTVAIFAAAPHLFVA